MDRTEENWHPLRQWANRAAVDAIDGVDRVLGSADARMRFSRLWSSRQNAVLMYHSVGGIPGYVGSLPVERFVADLEALVERYDVVDLPAVLDPTETRPKRVALTFDDGFVDFSTTVLPLLREFDVPATVFVSSAFVDDESRALAYERHELEPSDDRLLMTEAELAELVEEDLVTIGNHTRTHPRLSTLDTATKREEILGAKSDLESRFGVTVDRFCYPYGDFDGEAVDIAASAHDLSVTIDRGLVAPSTDPHRIPRIDGNDPRAEMWWRLTDLRYVPATVLGRTL
ncbi:polysaccharide deacetylase family protein [Halomarina oriensis]|uniref:Polysaccharide deacetylase family protein n=2 Tax=Halomarina oriensis TaxID=671145 RepID=A0A6B0GP50_9EURY|nr:polysaccharide deacetylase family protein [Halomarina oriensis]